MKRQNMCPECRILTLMEEVRRKYIYAKRKCLRCGRVAEMQVGMRKK